MDRKGKEVTDDQKKLCESTAAAYVAYHFN